jgi:signal transduction histidine kinase
LPLRVVEHWIGLVRLIAVPLVAFNVAATASEYPPGREAAAWSATAVFAVGSIALFVAGRRLQLSERAWLAFSIGAQVFELAVVSAFVLIYSFEAGTPVTQALYLPLVAACVRFQILGGIAVAVATVPVIAVFEELRSDRFGGGYHWDFVTLQFTLELLLALIVGWLVGRLARESARAEARADEAELLRDELGRRADLVEAANRCARALSSSLELDEAFGAFIRELRGLVPFDRVAIVLAEDGAAHVMATAGAGAAEVFGPGTREPLAGSLLEQVLASPSPINRVEFDPAEFPEESALAELGLRSRLAAPLLAGTRAVGMLSLGRSQPRAFTPAETELVGLLGRLVATAVQNIRSYEAERRNVDELRRLSTMRADFVSVVSHELRTPLTSVIGSARTLRERWRDLPAEQRDSLLDLAVAEADRLATLVAEVLDTSRIDAGTFSYSFDRVDVEQLVEAAVAAASGHEVGVVARVHGKLPPIRGDEARLRQVLGNLIDNAIKYSPHDGTVDVGAADEGGRVVIDVTDRGVGIEAEDLDLVFEKFGRVSGQGSRPGTGLGLYIARAIVEAHGGALEVSSAPGRGSTFTLTLPAG